MAFESLSERLQNAIKMFRGTKAITEEDLKEPLRQVRMALLEADVNFKVAKNFVAKIKERALGAEIQQNLSPSQQIIKIVDEELTALLGGTQAKLTVADKPPTIIMLVGLYFGFTYVMMYIVILNIGLAVFNMLPIMPLDGSRIFNWILPDRLTYKIEHALSRVNPIVYLVVFFVVIRLLSGPLWSLEYSLFQWIMGGVDWVFDLLGLAMA